MTRAIKKKPKGRTFQCTGYPDCNMTFTRSEHLARHIRKHTGERPFECVHCARKFSRLDNLRQHKQTVHANEHFTLKDELNENELSSSEDAQLQLQQDHRQQQQQQHPQQSIVVQEVHSSSQRASSTLLRPTQFRSKHRPRPIALPNNSVYNDAPYTVPTPRSATNLLSPSSPAHSYYLSTQTPVTATGLAATSSQLPSVQFLTTNVINHEPLISPYNSSFGSSNFSNSNTPTNSSFDSNLKTPTSVGSAFTSPNQPKIASSFENYHHLSLSLSQQQQQQQQQQRRSWLDNVLNSDKYQQYNHIQSKPLPSLPVQQLHHQHQQLKSQPPPFHKRSGSDPSVRKLRIESLLNTTPTTKNKTESSNPNDKIRLPNVGSLGIDVGASKN